MLANCLQLVVKLMSSLRTWVRRCSGLISDASRPFCIPVPYSAVSAGHFPQRSLSDPWRWVD